MKEGILQFFVILKNRHFLTLLLIGVLAGSLGLTIYALQHVSVKTQQHAAGGNPPTDGQAIYDSCGAKCLNHLDLFSQMGFKEVLDYSIWGNTSTADILAYANRAQQDHIKIIWSLKDMWNDTWTTFGSYGQLTKECGCSNKQQLMVYLINQIKNLPATWGYYVADEPGAADFNTVSTFSNLIHRTDPNHPRLIIQMQANNALALYAPITDVIGQDYYPTANHVDINKTGPLAATTQSVADTYHIQSAMVLEVNAGVNSVLPNIQQMQTQLDQTIQNSHTKLILWYWYPNTPTISLESLSQVINSIEPLPPTPSNISCVGNPEPNDPASNSESPILKGVANTSTIHSITNYNWQAHDGPALAVWPQILGSQSQALMGNSQYCARTWCDSNNMIYETFAWTPGYTTWQNPKYNDYTVTYWFLGKNNNNAFGSTIHITGNSMTVRVGPSYFFGNSLSIVKVANHYGEIGWPHTSFTLPTCNTQATTPTPTDTPTTAIPTPTNTPTTSFSQPGDLNDDKKVDILDYNILIHCFNHYISQPDSSCPKPSIADINRDGIIDGIDYNIFLRSFINYSIKK